MTPKLPQNDSKMDPKMVQDSFKTGPRQLPGFKQAPDGPRPVQDGPKTAQERPKTGPDPPKTGPRRPSTKLLELLATLEPIWSLRTSKMYQEHVMYKHRAKRDGESRGKPGRKATRARGGMLPP